MEELSGHERQLTQGTGRAGAGMRAAFWFDKARNVSSLLQLLGAGCLMVAVICHIFEGLHLFSSDGLGARAKRWPLHRSLECRSGAHTISRRILVSRAYKTTRLAISA